MNNINFIKQSSSEGLNTTEFLVENTLFRYLVLETNDEVIRTLLSGYQNWNNTIKQVRKWLWNNKEFNDFLDNLRNKQDRLDKNFLSQKIELIMDTPKKVMIEKYFLWNITREQLENDLLEYVEILVLMDKTKQETWLSWWMWRLAISEWDEDKCLDAPIFKKELKVLIDFLDEYLPYCKVT